MATIFKPQIDALMLVNFPDVNGYDAAFRTAMATFQDTFIVTLVPETDPAEEYTDEIREAVRVNSPNNYWNSVEPFRSLFFLTCEQVVNIAIDYYTGSTGGIQQYTAQWDQAAAANPVLSSLKVNSIKNPATGAVVVPTVTRNAGGKYHFNFLNTGIASNKAKLDVDVNGFEPTRSVSWDWAIIDGDTIEVNTYVASADVGTGVITTAAADSMLNDTRISFTLRP